VPSRKYGLTIDGSEDMFVRAARMSKLNILVGCIYIQFIIVTVNILLLFSLAHVCFHYLILVVHSVFIPVPARRPAASRYTVLPPLLPLLEERQ
jgi:hypothetical protein